MPGKKAMVVISNGRSMKATGTLDRVLKELASADVETVVFDHVQANPLRSTVRSVIFPKPITAWGICWP